MSKEIIINHTSHETRVAVLEEGTLSELHHEREQKLRVVDNIYKGKVLNVLPGMESAFVDIGEERAAFLHIDDILPEKKILGDEIYQNDEKQQISNIIQEGQDILVQVSKGPIGTKGARITNHVSIPGRNLVFLPTTQTLGVSRQISLEKERERLKEIVNRLRPENAGFIIRTVAEGHTEEDLHSDINYLVSIWEDVLNKFKTLPSPSLLHSDLNIIFRTIRDLFSSDIKKLIVDDKSQFHKVRNFVRSYLPRYGSVLENYSKKEPVFDHYGVENEIDRALGNKVWLRSGGYLVIDQTEALTAVDVNTGRFVGKESHEKTILRTNIEAAEELVYQLQLRNIGGIIIIDFIDMESQQHRQIVYQTLKDHLRTDKARSKILQISEMGLVEMTRKRDRENLNRYLCDPCPYCDGSGQIKSASTISYEAFREIRRSCQRKSKGSIVIYFNSDVYNYIQESEIDAVKTLETEIGRNITFKFSDAMHHEQFEIYEY
tara:strand:+ start:460 stop:1929 length:1470 start_codon:yes stop_codon:yes gene_type:complete